MLLLCWSYLSWQQVTQGARKKIVQSIMKLRERSEDLKTMEKNVIQGLNFQIILEFGILIYSMT